ncbi:hypothetical protein SAMN04488109_0477 [Chryseolinea serpens]|uniref:Uncharacterized protein n=1 Tax=Chryseolinea serpens TaxID=947013 RepID=A0A1M5K6Z9_9BACT|nr:hypothetical protein [Chryseolinea serpens]SHG48546.1 hypothetical protein SAMN04488109_0477 [Chryseolinea serpens]
MKTSGRQQSLAKYLFLVLPIALAACGEKIIDLDKKNPQEITYEALPNEVRTFIDEHIDSTSSPGREMYFSTNPSVVFTYARSGVLNTGWMDDANTTYHHFFIDGVHFRMKGNKGQPFILHDGAIYFCDLDLHKDSYKTRPYFKVEAIAPK